MGRSINSTRVDDAKALTYERHGVRRLTTQFLRLGVASEEGPRGLEAALPPHQKWLASRVASQAKKWPAGEIETALEGLLRADRLLKASPHTDLHFLEEWLLGMMTRAVAA